MKNNDRKIQPLHEKPRFKFFTEFDKLLTLQKFTFQESTPSIFEDESVFLYINAGFGTIRVNGMNFELRPDTFCWLQSNHIFKITPDWGEKLEISACAIDYPLITYLAFKGDTQLGLSAMTSRPPIIYCDGDLADKVKMLFSDLEKECLIEDAGSGMIRSAILGQLVLIFNHACVKLYKAEEPFVLNKAWEIHNYISIYCAHQLTAEEVAKDFGLTEKSLNQELRMTFGMNFSQLLTRARINLAASTVLLGELTFNYVSYYVGFQVDVAFYRAFNEVKGMTPQEYQKLYTSNRKIVNETEKSIIHYIYLNFREKITLSTAAKELYLSENVIRSILKRSFGTNFHALLTEYRIRYAEALLVVSDIPIIDIANMAGFNSAQTFTRLFKTANGMPPNAFREKYRGDEA